LVLAISSRSIPKLYSFVYGRVKFGSIDVAICPLTTTAETTGAPLC